MGRDGIFERAMAKAEARLAEQSRDAAPSTPDQAGAATAAAASSPAGADGAAVVGEATSDPAAQAPGDSTAEAPTNWPSDRREAFAQLPQAARPLVLDFYRDMQAGFTRATQGVAEIKQQADDYARIQAQAQADPRGFLLQLAETLGVSLDAPKDEPPEFATAGELAKWAADQASRQAETRIQAMHRQAQEAAAQERARAAFEAELANARKLPGFTAAAEDAVIKAVIDSGAYLSVEQAWDLQQVGALREAAGRVPQLEAELRALKAADEARRKGFGAPPQGLGVREAGAAAAVPGNRFEAAADRALKRLAAA